MWKICNKLDGISEHLMRDENCVPALFKARHLAKAWIEKRYGYIRNRRDLRQEPHGWRLPKPVRVTIAPKNYSAEEIARRSKILAGINARKRAKAKKRRRQNDRTERPARQPKA